MKYAMKRFIRLACLTGVLLGAISTVQGQSRQIRLGDNMGDHMAAKDLDMNSKQILNADGIAIGSATITNQNVAFQIDGTDKAILMPRVTALTAIATPVNGMLVYNSTDNKFYVRENGAWVSFATVTDLNNKTSNITVDNISIIKDNTGVLSANINSAIWNANRLQGNAVSATAPLTGQVLSWNGTAWVPANSTAVSAQTVTGAAQPAITSVGTLTGLSVTNPIAGSVTGNAATATKLATPRNINGVPFDGSANITITAAADANTLTGTTLNPSVLNSSLTSVGTLTDLTVTNPIAGSITGNAATATSASTAGTVTTAAQPAITSVGTLSGLTVSAPIAGSVTGNAGTATKLATARNINGVPFDGTSDITISSAADANLLTGNTLKSTVLNSSLTSVGTLTDLTVTNPIAGSITGNAATATSATTAGTVTTAAQPAITSVGTLTGLTVTNPIAGSVTGSAATVTAAAQPAITSVGTLSGLTVSAPIAGSVTGNAGTATKLATARNINGVAFDGTSDITISAAADANLLTGNTLKSTVLNSSLTSVGTLTDLTVSNPIVGSITGNAASATSATSAGTAGTVTDAAQPAITSVGTLTGLTVTAPITGSVTGNAGTATKLATPRTINGVAFDGSANITISASAAANALTGTTLAAGVTGSSLTSVGTLGSLTVTAPISGSVTGNAATATALATPRTINGVAFDGTSNINITATADAGTLTGSTP
jgi:hypothetical protein